MKAVRIREPKGFEGIDGLVYEDAPDPRPAISDVLVQVRAASFTPTELMWPLSTDRSGHDRGARIPAHEGSGVVVALGYGTAGVSVGDEVYGLIDGYRDGWAAELVAIEARSVAPKPTTRRFRRRRRDPASRAHVVAGVVRPRPPRARTDRGDPWRWRRGRGRSGCNWPAGLVPVSSGLAEPVLASACSSWARMTSSTSNRPAGRRRSVQVDLVYDIIGGDVLARSSAIVKPGGALVSVVGEPHTDRDDIRTAAFVRDPNGAQLREIARLVDEGTLRSEVSAVYPLADAREAFMAKSREHISGKVVLTP